MSDIVHSAKDAWEVLVLHGGLEMEGRDTPLVEELAAHLSVGTISQIANGPLIEYGTPTHVLNDILERVTIEQLVNALFGLVRPYTGMMRDLLDYFTRARVTQGPGQWKLALTAENESLEMDLEHFKEYIKVAETRRFPVLVPVLAPGQFWSIIDAFRDEPDESGCRLPIGRRATTQETDSGPWLSAAEAAKNYSTVDAPPWLPVPPLVSRMLERNDGLKDAAAVLLELASTVQAHVPNYRVMDHAMSELRKEVPEGIWNCLQIEHDRWIETTVANFAAFEIASTIEQASIADKLNELFNGVERKTGEFTLAFEDLLAYLNLPIWRRRYELFSAWLLTQLLEAMQDHDIELHSEDGKLTFGFHATKFATIHSLRQPVTIYGERRVQAANLKSDKRKRGIQPDYTIWIDEIELCNMAIECKHYKQPSYENFSHALDDYAANLPAARVILCNYGPIPVVTRLDSREGGASKRRFVFGDFHPGNTKAISAFKRAVLEVFGNPILAQRVQEQRKSKRVLALDVSASMRDALAIKAAQEEIGEIARELGITHFAAVDDELRALEKADCGRIDWLACQAASASTELGAAAETLRGDASEVYFLTDEDGVRTLGLRAQRMFEFMERFEELHSRQVQVVNIVG